ncbi:MAG: OmpA family protein [Cyclobacteriaceae bacterium]|nr:OmpA family protein [Cyclobacteriaceae bacterium]
MNRVMLSATLILSAVTAFTMNLDSLIVECNVTNIETNEPVVATVKYESLPYGSKIGIRNTSNCSFKVEKDEEYIINVTADGFLPERVKVKYSDHADEGKIIEEIKLTPSTIGKIMRLEKLIFPQGESTITESSYEELDKLVTTLNENPNMQIQLEGHTDFRGDAKLNMKLSRDRVEATRDYLVSKGIDRVRIKTEAFGGTKPLSRVNDSKSSELNRRVEVRILSN